MAKFKHLLVALGASLMLGQLPAHGADIGQDSGFVPEELNQRAMEALIDNDLSSARIYLERAHRLSPNNTDITFNLDQIRKLQTSGASYDVISQQPKATDTPRNEAQTVNGKPSQFPALWAKPASTSVTTSSNTPPR